MTKAEKNQIIDSIVKTLSSFNGFYVADISTLNSEKTSKLRRLCFEKKVTLSVAKNSLIQKALERMDAEAYKEVFPHLAGSSALMLSETANLPAKLIKEFRKKTDRPLIKVAYIDSSIFIGDNQIDVLANLKSREELIGDVIGLLQSPAKNVISALQSGGQKISGILKTLEDKKS